MHVKVKTVMRTANLIPLGGNQLHLLHGFIIASTELQQNVGKPLIEIQIIIAPTNIPLYIE